MIEVGDEVRIRSDRTLMVSYIGEGWATIKTGDGKFTVPVDQLEHGSQCAYMLEADRDRWEKAARGMAEEIALPKPRTTAADELRFYGIEEASDD